jgi:hypothetical protein
MSSYANDDVKSLSIVNMTKEFNLSCEMLIVNYFSFFLTPKTNVRLQERTQEFFFFGGGPKFLFYLIMGN